MKRALKSAKKKRKPEYVQNRSRRGALIPLGAESPEYDVAFFYQGVTGVPVVCEYLHNTLTAHNVSTNYLDLNVTEATEGNKENIPAQSQRPIKENIKKDGIRDVAKSKPHPLAVLRQLVKISKVLVIYLNTYSNLSTIQEEYIASYGNAFSDSSEKSFRRRIRKEKSDCKIVIIWETKQNHGGFSSFQKQIGKVKTYPYIEREPHRSKLVQKILNYVSTFPSTPNPNHTKKNISRNWKLSSDHILRASLAYNSKCFREARFREMNHDTRRWVFADYESWLKKLTLKPKQRKASLFAIVGPAGIGKSVVLSSICEGDEVIASYFFTQNEEIAHLRSQRAMSRSERNITALINCLRCLSMQLEQAVDGFESVSLDSSFGNQHSYKEERLILLQAFNELIATPIQVLLNNFTEGQKLKHRDVKKKKIVLVIDGLDYCGIDLVNEFVNICCCPEFESMVPEGVGIVISLRPNKIAESTLDAHRCFHITRIESTDERNINDIGICLHSSLHELMRSEEYKYGVESVLRKSKGFFFYLRCLNSALLCNPQQASDDCQRLVSLSTLEKFSADTSAATSMEIYNQYFGRVLDELTGDELEKYLPALLVSRYPIPLSGWKEMVQDDLEFCGWIEQLVTSSETGISFLHTSLKWYFQSKMKKAKLSWYERQGHSLLSKWALAWLEGDMFKSNKTLQEYASKSLVFHLCSSKEYEQARAFLLDFEYLISRISISAQELLNDIDLYYMRARPNDIVVRMVTNVIRLGEEDITKNPREFPGQVLARIDVHKYPECRQLISAAEEFLNSLGTPWYRPVIPSLQSAGSFQHRFLQTHSYTATVISISPNGDLIASAGEDGDCDVGIFDASSGKQKHTLSGHQDAVKGIYFSVCGTFLITLSCRDCLMLTWNVLTGVRLNAMLMDSSICEIDVAPNSSFFAGGYPSGIIRLWEIEQRMFVEPNIKENSSISEDDRDEKMIKSEKSSFLDIEMPEASILCMRISPDSEILATCSANNKIYMWSIESEALLYTFCGEPGNFTRLSFSNSYAWYNEGIRYIASASSDGSIVVWDIDTSKEKCVIKMEPNKGAVTDVNFSPDSKRMVIATAEATCLEWNIESNQKERSLSGHFGALTVAQYFPNQKENEMILTASHDCTVRIWNTFTFQNQTNKIGICDTSLDMRSKINCLSISPQGDKIVAGSKILEVWNAHTGELLQQCPTHTENSEEDHQTRTGISSILITNDSETLVAGYEDGRLSAFKLDDIQLDSAIFSEEVHSSAITCIAVNRLKNRLLTACETSSLVRITSMHSGELIRCLTMPRFKKLVFSVAFSPLDKYVAAGTRNGALHLWNGQVGGVTQNLKIDAEMTCFGFSKTARHIVAGTAKGIIYICRVSQSKSAQLQQIFGFGLSTSVESVFFHDGLLIAQGMGSQKLKAWNFKTRKSAECDRESIPFEYPETVNNTIHCLQSSPKRQKFNSNNSNNINNSNNSNRRPISAPIRITSYMRRTRASRQKSPRNKSETAAIPFTFDLKHVQAIRLQSIHRTTLAVAVGNRLHIVKVEPPLHSCE